MRAPAPRHGTACALRRIGWAMLRRDCHTLTELLNAIRTAIATRTRHLRSGCCCRRLGVHSSGPQGCAIHLESCDLAYHSHAIRCPCSGLTQPPRGLLPPPAVGGSGGSASRPGIVGHKCASPDRPSVPRSSRRGHTQPGSPSCGATYHRNMQRRERSTLSRYAGMVSGNEAGVVREGAYVPEARKMSAFVKSLLQNNFGSKSDARCT